MKGAETTVLCVPPQKCLLERPVRLQAKPKEEWHMHFSVYLFTQSPHLLFVGLIFPYHAVYLLYLSTTLEPLSPQNGSQFLNIFFNFLFVFIPSILFVLIWDMVLLFVSR